MVMDTQHTDQNSCRDELEIKAEELVSLALARCEERLCQVCGRPDAHAASLTFAVLTVRDAIQTFLNLERIP